jgi:hypothetical protein
MASWLEAAYNYIFLDLYVQLASYTPYDILIPAKFLWVVT